MTQNDSDYVIHIQRKADSPILPKILALLALAYVLAIVWLIAN